MGVTRIGITNIGAILSGSLEQPEVGGDALIIENGLIAEVGQGDKLDLGGCTKVVDARGTTVAPGIIDSHVHIVFGDWTPRQNTIGWIESYMHGGITSMMSASEVHLPGRPNDRAGVKALALSAQRAFQNFRPAGVKIHAGSVILEPTLKPEDFGELAQEGVWLAKMGFGSFEKNTDAAPLVEAARANGFVVMSHTGGVSIPGSNTITADDLLTLGVDIAGHVNGGTTALPDRDLERLIAEGQCCFQISQAGNIRSASLVIEFAREYNKLDWVLLSSDTPTGTGVMPLGTLKSIVEMATMTGLEAGEAWALATGHNAAVLRQNTGRIAPGREADLVVMDAPTGSAYPDARAAICGGDLPGISAVMIDGEIKALRSRNTPLATRLCEVREHNGVERLPAKSAGFLT